MAQHYDGIIIGTGAGGGTLAYRLAPSGTRVLLLERSDFLPRETQNWDVDEVFIKNRYTSPALTAMANALRVGDHLLARLG